MNLFTGSKIHEKANVQFGNFSCGPGASSSDEFESEEKSVSDLSTSQSDSQPSYPENQSQIETDINEKKHVEIPDEIIRIVFKTKPMRTVRLDSILKELNQEKEIYGIAIFYKNEKFYFENRGKFKILSSGPCADDKATFSITLSE